MTALSIQPPYPIFTEADGSPLENGFVYIGTANLDPVASPIAVFWDAALTVPAAQPIRTLNGYPSRNGTPARLYVGSDYSIRVNDSKGVAVYSAPAATERWSDVVVSGIDAASVSFLQAGLSATTRTALSKMRDIVSVKDFGALGNGVVDDTIAINAALASGAKIVEFPSGTYIIDGGLTLSAPGTTVVATGATIRLKANASSLSMLTITGADCVVEGGTWDGNKASGNIGAWGTAQYNSFNVYMAADRCTVKNIDSVNTWGMAIKGFGNYLSALNNRIRNTQHYGIFFDGSAAVSHTGNRAIGNVIDMSDGQIVAGVNQGQGILFTAGTGQSQTNWELSGNMVIGPTASVTDQAINLAVRGSDGVVTGNVTRFGGMGFSEGGDNCSVTGNLFLQLRGTTRIGIEPSGKFVATGNTISDAYVGIDCTASVNYDDSVASGNRITTVTGGSLSIGVRFQIASTFTAENVVISGNIIRTTNAGIYLVRSAAGTIISGNIITGPGIGSGRGVFLDNLAAAASVYILQNTFRNFERPWSVFSTAAVTYTDLMASNNITINCGASATTWPVEGSAAIGARCTVLGADNGSLNLYDVQANVFQWSSGTFGNPENNVVGGVGSIYASRANGNVYRKGSGTGNTGWIAM